MTSRLDKFFRQVSRVGDFWIEQRHAKLGDYSDTVIVPDAESMVYARLTNGQVIKVFNNKVSAIPHLDVLIGRDKSDPAVWKVIEQRFVFAQAQYPGFISNHHKQHEYPNGDTVFVRRDQFTPLLVLPVGGFVVRLYGDVIYRAGMTAPIRVANQDIDLSAYVAGTDQAWWVLMEVGLDGSLSYVQGADIGSGDFSLLIYEPLPAPSADAFPIAAFAFYDGQTELRRDDDERSIVDLRQFTSDIVNSAGVQLHDAPEKVTIVGGDEIFGADSEDTFSATKWLWSTVQSWVIAFADLLYAAIDHVHSWNEIDGLIQGHAHGLARWNGEAAQTTFDLPDIAGEIESFELNGLIEDPLNYALSADGTQVVLDTGLAYASTVTSRYIIQTV